MCLFRTPRNYYNADNYMVLARCIYHTAIVILGARKVFECVEISCKTLQVAVTYILMRITYRHIA